MRSRLVPFLLFPLILQAAAPTLPELQDAAQQMTSDHLLRYITELASDIYEGRLPGTPGEEKSVAYVISQCKEIGLQPGAPKGGWTQTVPLWGTLSHGTLSVTAGGKSVALTPGRDYVAWSVLPDKEIKVAPSDLVFVGYGAVAPEYHWDDYAGVDVHGKTVMILSGDPAVADPHDPSKLDEHMFLGRALTVYGRTGTKLETAYAHGAAAVILLSSAAQPGANLFQNYSRENMILRDAETRKRVKAQALLQADRAAELFTAAGQDLNALRTSAAGVPGCSFAGAGRVSDYESDAADRFRQCDRQSGGQRSEAEERVRGL